MTQSPPSKPNSSSAFSDQLIAAETTGSRADQARNHLPDPMFERLLESEQRREAQVRRLCLYAWATFFVCLLALTISFYIVRNAGGGILEVTRAALLFFAATGLVSLLAATVASFTWLFRSRSASLRAIERRLAALERLLLER